MNTTIDTQTDEKHPVKVERFTRNLKVLLTDEQVLERARRAASIAGEVQNKEAERDAAKKHANAQIEELEAELGRLNGEVRDGATYRDVECQRIFNYRLGTKVEVRQDTKEVIPGSEQPLTDRERQLALDIAPPTNGNGKGKAKADDAAGAVVDNDYTPEGEEPKLETAKGKGKGKGGRKPKAN